MNTTNTPADPQEAPSKQRSKYGTKTPYISFEECVRITKDVCKLAGFDGTIDALVKITGNSPSSSSFTDKRSAVKGFGLMTTQGQTYSLTDIGKRVAQPESAENEAEAIFEAFCKNDTLKNVWENYKGKILPQAEYIANYFETNLEIPTERKDDWASYFIEAAKYAGLLHERESGSYQVLLGPSVSKKTDVEPPTNGKGEAKLPLKKPESQIEALTKNPALPTIEVTESEHWGILSQRRISGNRKAVIAIPDELLQEDIDMLKTILKGIDVQLDGLKKYNA
ncbi:MAG: hypothetical protein HY033_04555 [Ignavibacteriae bacterium]|nr:hypothetical protein [Ignavibacteria bacterium]MBI3364160.1 hypothetical protein [Ignavibacteriota bacterium]